MWQKAVKFFIRLKALWDVFCLLSFLTMKSMMVQVQQSAWRKIPLEARVLTVADVYDSLTSDRPYRKAMSPFDAKDIIEKVQARSSIQKLSRRSLRLSQGENWKFQTWFFDTLPAL